ncbi:lipocalin-like domain-containing protein [Streptomyces noursei]|uniref:lipocalin-like domain-containing protein n=1 Tax=Streptomyces noursei TaxID=1971 RepID=UPI00081D0802|nr:hypothetical protein SNOUR_05890 [Streptomyces noursei ATCC 11455]MCZ0991955.1 lipocalin-like domain-containing protein [Streptomyces noursei]
MSVRISAPGRSAYTDGEVHGGTGAEQAEAARGYLAYAGTYTVTDDIVEHHVEHSLFPNWDDTVLPRTPPWTRTTGSTWNSSSRSSLTGKSAAVS